MYNRIKKNKENQKKGGRGRLAIRYKVREMKNGAQGEEEKDKFRNKKKR